MKYWVFYIWDSSHELKGFKSKKSLDNFLNAFHEDYDKGNWVELVFKGDIIKKDASL